MSWFDALAALALLMAIPFLAQQTLEAWDHENELLNSRPKTLHQVHYENQIPW